MRHYSRMRGLYPTDRGTNPPLDHALWYLQTLAKRQPLGRFHNRK